MRADAAQRLEHLVCSPMNDSYYERLTMELPPPVNPDVDVIADKAKFGYAVGKELISAVQYRLGELAGTGRLDPEESIRLQEVVFGIFKVLYLGTLGAIGDADAYDRDEGGNTYSDGRPVRTVVQVEPAEESVTSWNYSQFMLDYSYATQTPREQVTCTLPS